jgi:hypothetical protein
LAASRSKFFVLEPVLIWLEFNLETIQIIQENAMTTTKGFGKTPPAPKVSARSQQRAQAAQEYDEMKTKGVPDFEVYIRIKDKKPWYPVGSIAVKRSSQIHQAIYANQEDLLQGAFRLFPILKKNQQQLEYGFRLKEFKDEPIQLAEPPAENVGNAVQGAIAKARNKLADLFQPKK